MAETSSEFEEKDKYLLNSVNNTLSLLDVLSHHQRMSLAEMSRETGFDKTKLFRMLYTLEKNGFVTKDADACYGLGLKLLHLGGVVSSRQDITQVARGAMQRFSNENGLATHLGRLSADRVVTVNIANPPEDISISSRIGMSAPAYSTAMGRAIMANLGEYELAAICGQTELKDYANSPIHKLSDLYNLLDEVRKNGYASDVNERYQGFGSLAAPIFDYTSTCIAACGIVTLAQNIESNLESYVAKTKELAATISSELGYKA